MAKTIPCPNPTCSHDFVAAELQAAAQLLCPKCGFAMKGTGQAPAKPPAAQQTLVPPAKKKAPAPAKLANPAAPASKPQAPSPAARPAVPAKPATPAAPTPAPPAAALPVMAMPVTAEPKGPVVMAMPVSAGTAPAPASPVAAGEPPVAPLPNSSEDSVPDGAYFDPGMDPAAGTLVKTKAAPKKKFDWRKFMVYAFAIGISVSLVITAVASLIWFFVGPGGLRDISGNDGTIYWGLIRDAKGGNEKIYKLVLRKDEWTIDGELTSQFNAHTAYRSNAVDFWFVLAVKDYGIYRPRDADMLRIGIEKLESHFQDNLELAANAQPVKFMDIPAVKLAFKGQYKQANWLGECYMVFKDGVAFWLYFASPDWANVEYFTAELPGRNIEFVVDRKGWREQPMPTETFASANNKLFVTGPKGVWEKHNAKDEDENGELLLLGRYLKEKDNTKNALMLFFTMEKKDSLSSALKAAKDYVESKAKNSDPSVKFELAVDPAKDATDLGTIETFGNRRARIVDLKMSRSNELKRFFLIGAISDPDITYVFLCECTWANRQIWRSVFVDFLGTLRIKKDET